MEEKNHQHLCTTLKVEKVATRNKKQDIISKFDVSQEIGKIKINLVFIIGVASFEDMIRS